MLKRTEFIEEFNATTEDGQEFNIIVEIEKIDIDTFGSGHAETIEGSRSAHTSEGMRCNIIDKDTVDIMGTGKAQRV